MFQHVSTSIIPVSDQDKAKEFYLNTLGFVLRQDTPMYPGAPNRWLTVAPSQNAATAILLDLPTTGDGDEHSAEAHRALIGKSQLLLLEVTDMLTLVKNLKEKGVRFERDPEVNPWGTFATMLDQDGNKIGLVELPKAP
jgi:catechol 2,3-dioxygenase-like lactoylglutathione lyase family enzyme